MTTKKRDSIQEERIQNVAAPRAEPGAANMTIPRRDLLTGAALVLLGASGCGNGKQNCGNANSKLLRTDFMKAFTKTFIGDPTTIKDPAPPPATDPWPDPEPTNPPTPSTRVWPKFGQKQNDAITDYATFVNVLLTVGFVGASPPTFPSGSLGDQIVQFLNTYHWPTGTGVPSEYQSELPTVYLVEIAVIQDRLLQAINSFDFTGHGAGGNSSNWPPH
ncbi:MAG: hypothetical protein ACLQJ0_04240 [Steroidobacteraceae bacterium]|jgi:hypothetical protein